MNDLLDLLRMNGLPVGVSVKVVRHRDTQPGMDVQALERRDWLEVYQSYQESRIFECDYVVSCVGHVEGQARMFGVYRVVGPGMPTPRGNLPPGFPHPEFDYPGNFYYQLVRDDRFNELEGRVIVWNARPRNWHLWLARPGAAGGGRAMPVVNA